jgi:hypothetical protein
LAKNATAQRAKEPLRHSLLRRNYALRPQALDFQTVLIPARGTTVLAKSTDSFSAFFVSGPPPQRAA